VNDRARVLAQVLVADRQVFAIGEGAHVVEEVPGRTRHLPADDPRPQPEVRREEQPGEPAPQGPLHQAVVGLGEEGVVGVAAAQQ
jgi:hypothetical protein